MSPLSLFDRRPLASLRSVLRLAVLVAMAALMTSTPALAARDSLLSSMLKPDTSAVDPAQCYSCGCVGTPSSTGGSGGVAWTDGSTAQNIARCGVNYPSSIQTTSDSAINQITVVYGPNSTSSGLHGSTVGSIKQACSYPAGVYIKNISLWTTNAATASYVVSGIYTKDSSNQECSLGTTTGTPTWNSSSVFQSGWVVAYFAGRAGSLIDQLTIFAVNPTTASLD